MEESIDTFKVMYTTENLSFLEKECGRFAVLKLKCVDVESVLIVGFIKGKVLRTAKVPLRAGMHLNTLDEVKTYLLESMIEN